MRASYRGMLLGNYVGRYATKPIPKAIIGLGFGDEGKGMAVAHETGRMVAYGLRPLNVRFNGGPQAAHNVRVKCIGGPILHHTHSQFGSGSILGAETVITRGTLFNPMAVAPEAGHLSKITGDDVMCRLTVDERCPVIVPTFIELNRALERMRGNGRHGSTGTGVGIARTCEDAARQGKMPKDSLITVRSLLYPTSLRRRLALWHDWLERRFDIRLGLSDDDAESEARWLSDGMKALVSDGLNVVEDATQVVREAISDGWTGVTFEGSQGTLLDERYGWFPHVTYGDMTALGAYQVAGGSPIRVVGVTRCYQTRHGAGPMPTENTCRITEHDNGASEWAGAFRTGFLDLPTLSRAAMAVGIDELAVSCIDRYPGAFVVGWEGSRSVPGCRRRVPSDPIMADASIHALLREMSDACFAPVLTIGHGMTNTDWSDCPTYSSRSNTYRQTKV